MDSHFISWLLSGGGVFTYFVSTTWIKYVGIFLFLMGIIYTAISDFKMGNLIRELQYYREKDGTNTNR